MVSCLFIKHLIPKSLYHPKNNRLHKLEQAKSHSILYVSLHFTCLVDLHFLVIPSLKRKNGTLPIPQ